MTSWAILALLDLLGPQRKPVHRGLAWLRCQQRVDGSWPQSAVTGVFFGTAMLDYKSYFPLWSLAQAGEQMDGLLAQDRDDRI
jgi:lanosterol synthase